jgi:hypothetical protein
VPDDFGDPFADFLLALAQDIQCLAVIGQIPEVLGGELYIEVTLGNLLDRLQSQADRPGDPFPERTLAHQGGDDRHGHPATGCEHTISEGKYHQRSDTAQPCGEQGENAVAPLGDCFRLSYLGRVHGSADLPCDTRLRIGVAKKPLEPGKCLAGEGLAT